MNEKISMNIKDVIENRISQWEKIGHPALIERFVFRNGKVFEPTKLKGKLLEPKNCFGNSTARALQGFGSYIEGYAIREDIGLEFIHAWVNIDGKAMDPTIKDNKDIQYFGVEFSNEILSEEIVKNGYYGLLDSPSGINYKLLFRFDPELKPIVEKIIGRKIA